MFECKACKAHKEIIELLKKQNEDLHNRLMSFNQDAFVNYQAQLNKGEPLYPKGIDAQGKILDYKETDPQEIVNDTLHAFGEEPVEVEDK